MKIARLIRQSTSNIAQLVRDAWRSDAIQKVEDALAERNSETGKTALHELERHGARIVIVVIVHSLDSAGALTQQRSVGWISDNASWNSFVEAVAECTRIDLKAMKDCTFTYSEQRDGSDVLLSGAPSLRKWLDASWLSHPLEVHVHRTAVLTQKEERSKIVRDCFDKFDTGTNRPWPSRRQRWPVLSNSAAGSAHDAYAATRTLGVRAARTLRMHLSPLHLISRTKSRYPLPRTHSHAPTPSHIHCPPLVSHPRLQTVAAISPCTRCKSC